MIDFEIKLLKELPELRASTLPPAERAELLMNSARALVAVYAEHFGLSHLSGKMRVSLYDLMAVTYLGPDGGTVEAIGAVAGPKGARPVLTILLPMDDSHSAMVCNSTRTWVDQFGTGGHWKPEDELDLDRS